MKGKQAKIRRRGRRGRQQEIEEGNKKEKSQSNTNKIFGADTVYMGVHEKSPELLSQIVV